MYHGDLPATRRRLDENIFSEELFAADGRTVLGESAAEGFVVGGWVGG